MGGGSNTSRAAVAGAPPVPPPAATLPAGLFVADPYCAVESLLRQQPGFLVNVGAAAPATPAVASPVVAAAAPAVAVACDASVCVGDDTAAAAVAEIFEPLAGDGDVEGYELKKNWKPGKSQLKRKRKHGFRQRMSSKAGRRLLKRRMKKGRTQISA